MRDTQGVHMSSCYFSTHFFLCSEASFEMEDKKSYLIKNTSDLNLKYGLYILPLNMELSK